MNEWNKEKSSVILPQTKSHSEHSRYPLAIAVLYLRCTRTWLSYQKKKRQEHIVFSALLAPYLRACMSISPWLCQILSACLWWVQWSPSQKMCLPRTCEHEVIWKRFFACVIQWMVSVGVYPGLAGWARDAVRSVLRGETRRRNTGEGHGKAGAYIWVRCLQAKNAIAGGQQKPEGRLERVLPRSLQKD